MNKYHNVQSIKFIDNKLILKVDGTKYDFHIDNISNKLEKASKLEREKYKISPSGYGIHWSVIDEDVSIDGLLAFKNH